MLPIEIQMQIDLMAADAKRAVTEGFAAVRERLLPELPADPWRQASVVSVNWTNMCLQQALAHGPSFQQSLDAYQPNYNQLSAQQQAWQGLCGGPAYQSGQYDPFGRQFGTGMYLAKRA